MSSESVSPPHANSRGSIANLAKGPEAEDAPRPMQGAPDDIVVFNHGAKRSLRFWAIMVSLMITGLMSSIEGTIITSALPTITRALGGGNLYIWVPNAFFLSFIATLPLFAQVSDIFGRRWPFIIAVALFVLGSGICGGSVNMGMCKL